MYWCAQQWDDRCPLPFEKHLPMPAHHFRLSRIDNPSPSPWKNCKGPAHSFHATVAGYGIIRHDFRQWTFGYRWQWRWNSYPVRPHYSALQRLHRHLKIRHRLQLSHYPYRLSNHELWQVRMPSWPTLKYVRSQKNHARFLTARNSRILHHTHPHSWTMPYALSAFCAHSSDVKHHRQSYLSANWIHNAGRQ